MACLKLRYTKCREDDDYYDYDECYGRNIGFYASNFSELVNELSKRGISTRCDNKSKPSLVSNLGFRDCDLNESPPLEDHKVSEPIRVQINPEGRNKMIESDTDLAYIFSVRVLDLKGRSECKIYGKIVLEDVCGKIHLFKRTKEDPLTITPMDIIPLTGPERGTWALDDFSVGVRLLEEDNVLLEGWFYSRSESPAKDNKVNIEVFDDKKNGEHGMFAVTFSIMQNAVQAEVEMKLIDNENSSTKVWGTVTASIDGDADMTAVIFDKKSDESIDVSCGDPIPLSRKLLTLRCSQSVIISANMRDSACIPLLFKPEYFGDYVETIASECGMIQVKVTWFSYVHKPPY